MNEIRIRKTGRGSCDECGQVRKGVAFEIGVVYRSGESFLCWEHFRLLLEAMKPGRTVVEERVIVRGCSCHQSCRCLRLYAHGRSETLGMSASENESAGGGWSKGAGTVDTASCTQSADRPPFAW